MTAEAGVDRRGFLKRMVGRGAVAAAGAAGASALFAESANAAHDATNVMHVGQTNTGISATTTLTGSTLSLGVGNQQMSLLVTNNTGGNVGIETGSTNGTALRITPDGNTTAMPPAANTWQQGSLRVDGGDGGGTNGDIWYCYEAGTGSASGWYPLSLVPAFIPLSSPQRIYYSGDFGGPILNGQERDISSLTGGFVPATAFAVLVNLAVIQTTGTVGFLAAFSADQTYPGHSNLNWFGNSQVLANSCVTGTDVNGDFTIRCGTNGSAGTHFVVDVMGFYTLTA